MLVSFDRSSRGQPSPPEAWCLWVGRHRAQLAEKQGALAAYSIAVYASHPPVARRMATLATGMPATALTGLDLHQLDSYKEFHCLITDPPFPRLAQRDLVRVELRPATVNLIAFRLDGR